MKYIKRPIVIEAFRYGHHDKPEWFNMNLHIEHQTAFFHKDKNAYEYLEPFIMIQTLEGAMRACLGDYIIKGIAGEIYPCKAEIFNELYDLFIPVNGEIDGTTNSSN
jgi:hypothetical protein